MSVEFKPMFSWHIVGYLSRKISLLQNNKELQVSLCYLMVNYTEATETNECFFMDLGGGIVNNESILKVKGIVTFHWLSYGSLPLAELLLGKGEILSSFCWGNVVSLPVVDARYISSCGSQLCALSEVYESSLF